MLNIRKGSAKLCNFAGKCMSLKTFSAFSQNLNAKSNPSCSWQAKKKLNKKNYLLANCAPNHAHFHCHYSERTLTLS
ncbi:hypothetical protein BpHYR1_013273 [Brachionus plicatilis]|uniref:Uncharacterized protein n=1 Tax=Brachionus plicatilis TaxID=10195 RepID=A0A3M7SQ19_BRAPC|nr:hypothetical protein BpHYR1_013273 [Brachionus plicatilis]